ncbi:macro domain-like protein [Zopfia rhizophila CBS 207.26]|uniref:Macro domain-like protein n=1 Tax=Zopfia rhizophila CBS 207.26 TaxID=1314779 RepID=A0A6A6EL86_9PEZI|nr:macro domain-like protein [Zopfia rhizophila CBS 207.26]
MGTRTSPPVPHIHLLCVEERFSDAFERALAKYNLPFSGSVTIHKCALSFLPSSVQFDTIVSPANSYGRLDGAFDDAISRAFSPEDDYLALTHVAQALLYKEWRGFAPPGTCTLLRMPDGFQEHSKNVWGTKYLALCPTMRVPQEVKWDREVVYECIWSLLCAIDKHNQLVQDGKGASDVKIQSLLMTPLATGCGRVSAERWASQAVLAIKHFVEATENQDKWSALEWADILDDWKSVQDTWTL